MSSIQSSAGDLPRSGRDHSNWTAFIGSAVAFALTFGVLGSVMTGVPADREAPAVSQLAP